MFIELWLDADEFSDLSDTLCQVSDISRELSDTTRQMSDNSGELSDTPTTTPGLSLFCAPKRRPVHGQLPRAWTALTANERKQAQAIA
ncbi:hypothetical protein [Sporosarcina koreensis]|uniref:hypothetical protein n=1 Tax=Sporosarcina koreensis TaxID=334735 RepID=UPI0005906665|nr:hypothetical protein [Sporosarcina koreensis]